MNALLNRVIFQSVFLICLLRYEAQLKFQTTFRRNIRHNIYR